ncbi:polyprenyl-pyrophosphate binding protein [Candidatus Terasakiella magnetica]|uniref:Polyprenyl-pyrophosphate binding protein n=1 Tax=Candidatus Terasakiella magnetica TaxID=1867952 RepID=A0A1C3RE61_9PROT|nr:YceI family protein [Candidatus Terasakiella magnetica]SCA55522.1 polyprenyl-pyrophosphate binding protein [Candidatus Terasakiella magnetica]
MKKIILSTVFALGLSVSAVKAEPVQYHFDKSHSSIEFRINHLGFSNFQGEFQGFDGTLLFDEAKPENSSVNVTIDAASIDTDVAALDAHLKKADFFDVAKFPTLSFKSKSIKVTGENTGEITGDLTLHGVTKEVVLLTTLNKAALHPMMKVPAVGFSASTTIKRSDFGVSAYVPAVGDEVTIRIETEAHAK